MGHWKINIQKKIPMLLPKDSETQVKKAISVCNIEEEDYFSSLVVRSKKNGSFCSILNLKYLNK